jgi:hypothetical protein
MPIDAADEQTTVVPAINSTMQRKSSSPKMSRTVDDEDKPTGNADSQQPSTSTDNQSVHKKNATTCAVSDTVLKQSELLSVTGAALDSAVLKLKVTKHRAPVTFIVPYARAR